MVDDHRRCGGRRRPRIRQFPRALARTRGRARLRLLCVLCAFSVFSVFSPAFPLLRHHLSWQDCGTGFPSAGDSIKRESSLSTP
jgi:hypothetical protein